MSSGLLDKIHVGTSGWSYDDWVGPFYNEHTAALDYLSLYAQSFRVVEVDSTFYAIPSRRTVEGWAARSPDGFRFALKVPGIVTHGAQGERAQPDKVLLDEGGAFESFFSVIEPLGEKIGPLVLQFPYFRVKEMEAADFQDRLRRTLEKLPRERRFAVEIRNKKWITPEYLRLLTDNHAAAVMIDHPYMPPPAGQLALGMVTTDFAYVRLLGDRYAIERKTQRWDRTVEDKSGRIEQWAEVIRKLIARAELRGIYAFSNNHFAGHGPATSRELLDRLKSGA